MTVEGMIAFEEAARSFEVLVNAFADLADRTRQRLVQAGWSEDAAEAFAHEVVVPVVQTVVAKVAAAMG